MTIREELYPAVEPTKTGMLKVDDIHELYWEELGNPQGTPVVFLHGGPGGGISPDHRRYFDPAFYRIILFDQRGSGRSTPYAELKNNTPKHLADDIETLRKFLNVEKWLVFGGSWGSTLAILYGETYPQSCLGFILRGVFTMRPEEIDWFMNGVKHFLPEAWHAFAEHVPEEERDNLLKAYHKRLNDPDPKIHMAAAKIFSRTEGSMSTLLPNQALIDTYEADGKALSLARIEVDYFLNHSKELGETLIHNLNKINHLPVIIVQGRYDLCCPPITAYEVAKKWPHAILTMVPDGGHSAAESGVVKELVRATEMFKQKLK